MAVRYCRVHGEYRGLVCSKCHPRGTGEKAQLREATELRSVRAELRSADSSETRTPVPLFEQPTVTVGGKVISYNNSDDAESRPAGPE